MSDTIIDLDSLSDEDFLKLDPSDLQEVPSEAVEEINEEAVEDDTDTNTPTDPDPDGLAVDDDGSDSLEPALEVHPEAEQISEEETGKVGEGDTLEEETTPAGEPKKEEVLEPTPKDEVEGSNPKDKKDKPVMAPSESDGFMAKILAPFTADGKEVTVRTAEDAIRLMQMGTNYSRRMAEMKPLRIQDQMLKDNGLDSTKLNFLIDVSKGKPEAIQKLLKDHNIDPIDIDTAGDPSTYQATDYQGDVVQLDFKDAIAATMAAPGGKELINDINNGWDDKSKEALRDQPEIFENILAQKSSGVYAKINKELEYQRTMGFLKNVPFLQAYHEVGAAMQKQKVFDPVPEVQVPAKVVVATGPRKVAKPSSPTPNVLTATPPRPIPSSGGNDNSPDYSTLSDVEFLKLAPPG